MSDTWLVLTLVHLAASGVMTGLIWMVHVVHYPLFALVGDETYPQYQTEHMRRISVLLAVPWGAEVLLGALLFVSAPTTQLRWISFGAGALQVVIALVTALVAAPAHGRLVAGFNDAELRGLLRANLLRAGLWTVRLALAAIIVWLSVNPRR